MGGSGDSAGNTGVGSGGAPDDSGDSESKVISEIMDGSTDVGEEAAADAGSCAAFALQFGGFSYVRVNRPVQNDFTLEAWIKSSTPSLTGTNYWEGSGLLWADVVGDYDDFGASILNNKLAFGVGNPGGVTPTIVSVSSVIDSQWTHVAVTRKMTTGEIQVFVNGAREAAMVVATQTKSLAAQVSMTLGGNAYEGRFFVGYMDEVRAWNIVRTAADITATMHQKLVGNEPGLVGYWRFDEGVGTSTADATATKNDGGVFAAPNWVASDAPICP